MTTPSLPGNVQRIHSDSYFSEMPVWTEEHLRSAVTDLATLKRGLDLASPSKWKNLSTSPRAVWGECQGSGSKPYQTTIDITGPAFKCSCPSRTFPCKHGAGLMVLVVRQSTLFSAATEPDWVTTWLAKREAKETAKAEPVGNKAPADPEARAKRENQRQQRMADGLGELERWLLDVARTGLATLQAQPLSTWEAHAARLVDSQLPGLANRVREMWALRGERAGELRDALGELFLLVQAAKRSTELPVDLSAEVQQQLGVNVKKEDVLKDSAPINDQWWVLGRIITDEDRLIQRRTWLFGLRCERYALLLDHAFGSQGFASTYITNAVYEGALHFYPGSYPLRAIAVELHFRPEMGPSEYPASDPITSLQQLAHGIAANPWSRQIPMWLTGVVPATYKEGWYLRHKSGLIPMRCTESEGWSLAAQSGGAPMNIFGEWNGRALLPVRAALEHTSP